MICLFVYYYVFFSSQVDQFALEVAGYIYVVAWQYLAYPVADQHSTHFSVQSR